MFFFASHSCSGVQFGRSRRRHPDCPGDEQLPTFDGRPPGAVPRSSLVIFAWIASIGREPAENRCTSVGSTVTVLALRLTVAVRPLSLSSTELCTSSARPAAAPARGHGLTGTAVGPHDDRQV